MKIIAVHLNMHKEQNSMKDFEDLLMRIDSTLLQKICKFHRKEDRLRSLCGEILLQVFAKQLWHLSQEDMLREVNSYGKPGFTRHPYYQYNISHSGDWVVAAFDNLPVGMVLHIEGIEWN